MEIKFNHIWFSHILKFVELNVLQNNRFGETGRDITKADINSNAISLVLIFHFSQLHEIF